MSHTASPKEIGRQWFRDVWNLRRVDLIPQWLAPEAKGHLEGGVEIVGPDQFVHFQKMIFEVFPDIRIEVLNLLADGDDVCVLWVARATHSGRGMGLEPTQRRVEFRGTTWFHFQGGKIVEGWDSWNQGGLLAQLTAPA